MTEQELEISRLKAELKDQQQLIDAVAKALLGKTYSGFTYVPKTLPSEIAAMREQLIALRAPVPSFGTPPNKEEGSSYDEDPFTEHEKLVAGATLILQGLGVDLASHNFASTPERMAKVYEDLFTPKDTGWPVFDEEYTDIVIMRGFEFFTLCPHHMLPVRIIASVGYKPNGKVIGASKLVRLILECNRKPETQEKLTTLVCEAIQSYTHGTSLGEAVFMSGEHGCMRMRGIRSAGTDMVTWKFKGQFESDHMLQQRFFQLIGSGR